MKLTSEQLAKYKSKIEKLTGFDVNVFSNGLFDVKAAKNENLDHAVESIKKLPFVWDARIFFSYNPDGSNIIKGLLKESAKEDLEEAVEIHDSLNPKIWDGEELRPEVKEKILAIVQKFKQLLLLDKIDLKIDDIYLLGSNANYNYNEDSDLDIHIIADESFDCSEEHLGIIYNAYKTLFNNKYDITIKGINAEIYVENKDNLTNVSSGVYSLNDGWIKKPAVYDIPEIDQLSIDKQVQIWEDRYYSITENPSITKVDDYLNSIYDMRQNSIKKDGEFGEGNLVFKEIRRRGYLNKLRDLKIDLTSKELSLEGLNEGYRQDLYDNVLKLVDYDLTNGYKIWKYPEKMNNKTLDEILGDMSDERLEKALSARNAKGKSPNRYGKMVENDSSWYWLLGYVVSQLTLNESLNEDIEKEIKIQSNENIEKDIEELDPPIDLAYFPNELGINLSSVESEKWIEQDDGQLKKIEIEFDPTTKEVNEEAKQKIKYKYSGPIYVNLVKYDWEDETQAVSINQARSNILWKAKQVFVSNDVDLPDVDHKEFWTIEKQEDVFKPSTAKCKHCGALLNTLGECPVCDLGDETALEEKCNKN